MINVADLVNPASGKTYREENFAATHTVPLNALVEVMKYERVNGEYEYVRNPHGLRLYVTKHSRDCDGTPLYYLSHMTAEEYQRQYDLANRGVMHIDGFAVKGSIFAPNLDGGYSADSLFVVCEAPEIDD
jgi:hypothetical protein